jgi:hypothetical protein
MSQPSKSDTSTSQIVTGALFDFVGHLCSSPEFWAQGRSIKEELVRWAKARNLDLTEADVLNWDKHV